MKIFAAIAGISAFLAASSAGALDFGDWLPTTDAATTPYQSTDYLPLVQGTTTRHILGTAFGVQRLSLGWPAAIDPASNIIATIDQASTVRSIVGTVATPVGAAATVTVKKAPSGTSCASGTALHSSAFNANGTANTNQTLTVTVPSLSAGDYLCLITTGGANWTGGVGIGGLTVRITTP